MRRPNTYHSLSVFAALCFTLGSLAAGKLGGAWGAVVLLALFVSGLFVHRMIYQLGRMDATDDIIDESIRIQKQKENGD